MKYVIWQTKEEPWNGHPLDRPGRAVGVRTREDYDSKVGMDYLEGDPTEIVEEFEASSDKEADEHLTAWLDRCDRESDLDIVD